MELARRYGAGLALGEKVISFTAHANRVTVKTDKEEYEAEQVIVSAGPWINQFLGEPYRKFFTIYRQVLYWFDLEQPTTAFEPPHFPVWIWEFGTAVEDLMYGFPAIDGAQGGIKIASEQYNVATEPDLVSRDVTQQEVANMHARYVEPHFAGVSGQCLKAVTCLYTVTPDHRFVIDRHPEYPQVIIASPCSGHGFKHSASIGEALAQLAAEGRTDLDLQAFRFGRFLGE